MAYGNVYVFNLYSTKVTSFATNDQSSIGEIAAPAKVSSPPYTPSQLVVPRTNEYPDQLDKTKFCNGKNKISANYGGQAFSLHVTIPGPPNVPMEDDLWLYFAYEEAFMFTKTGALIKNPDTKDGSYPFKLAG